MDSCNISITENDVIQLIQQSFNNNSSFANDANVEIASNSSPNLYQSNNLNVTLLYHCIFASDFFDLLIQQQPNIAEKFLNVLQQFDIYNELLIDKDDDIDMKTKINESKQQLAKKTQNARIFDEKLSNLNKLILETVDIFVEFTRIQRLSNQHLEKIQIQQSRMKEIYDELLSLNIVEFDSDYIKEYFELLENAIEKVEINFTTTHRKYIDVQKDNEKIEIACTELLKNLTETFAIYGNSKGIQAFIKLDNSKFDFLSNYLKILRSMNSCLHPSEKLIILLKQIEYKLIELFTNIDRMFATLNFGNLQISEEDHPLFNRLESYSTDPNTLRSIKALSLEYVRKVCLIAKFLIHHRSVHNQQDVEYLKQLFKSLQVCIERLSRFSIVGLDAFNNLLSQLFEFMKETTDIESAKINKDVSIDSLQWPESDDLHEIMQCIIDAFVNEKKLDIFEGKIHQFTRDELEEQDPSTIVQQFLVFVRTDLDTFISSKFLLNLGLLYDVLFKELMGNRHKGLESVDSLETVSFDTLEDIREYLIHHHLIKPNNFKYILRECEEIERRKEMKKMRENAVEDANEHVCRRFYLFVDEMFEKINHQMLGMRFLNEKHEEYEGDQEQMKQHMNERREEIVELLESGSEVLEEWQRFFENFDNFNVFEHELMKMLVQLLFTFQQLIVLFDQKPIEIAACEESNYKHLNKYLELSSRLEHLYETDFDEINDPLDLLKLSFDLYETFEFCKIHFDKTNAKLSFQTIRHKNVLKTIKKKFENLITKKNLEICDAFLEDFNAVTSELLFEEYEKAEEIKIVSIAKIPDDLKKDSEELIVLIKRFVKVTENIEKIRKFCNLLNVEPASILSVIESMEYDPLKDIITELMLFGNQTNKNLLINQTINELERLLKNGTISLRVYNRLIAQWRVFSTQNDLKNVEANVEVTNLDDKHSVVFDLLDKIEMARLSILLGNNSPIADTNIDDIRGKHDVICNELLAIIRTLSHKHVFNQQNPYEHGFSLLYLESFVGTLQNFSSTFVKHNKIEIESQLMIVERKYANLLEDCENDTVSVLKSVKMQLFALFDDLLLLLEISNDHRIIDLWEKIYESMINIQSRIKVIESEGLKNKVFENLATLFQQWNNDVRSVINLLKSHLSPPYLGQNNLRTQLEFEIEYNKIVGVIFMNCETMIDHLNRLSAEFNFNVWDCQQEYDYLLKVSKSVLKPLNKLETDLEMLINKQIKVASENFSVDYQKTLTKYCVRLFDLINDSFSSKYIPINIQSLLNDWKQNLIENNIENPKIFTYIEELVNLPTIPIVFSANLTWVDEQLVYIIIQTQLIATDNLLNYLKKYGKPYDLWRQLVANKSMMLSALQKLRESSEQLSTTKKFTKHLENICLIVESIQVDDSSKIDDFNNTPSVLYDKLKIFKTVQELKTKLYPVLLNKWNKFRRLIIQNYQKEIDVVALITAIFEV
eukprot:TRINITY_DN9223_c0_g1_i1.p1 TRINITY_DN9223_c0_g1~~TRINITY_DN9223_c0_g1_i1.p1  ORF type:complete len:1494 (-),score=431.69 TRINITY_DN9223_c0_g1_i1:58-4419(-)